MKYHGRPVRTTILYGLFAAGLYMAVVMLDRFLFFWPAEELLAWLVMGGYGILLARWAKINSARVLAPFMMLLIVFFLSRSEPVMILASLLALGWVRSRICFPVSFGKGLFRIAETKNLSFAFEAAVGGGIPIIVSLRQGLIANRVQSIYGILNGTANYILSKMTTEGAAFPEVLEEAQQLGYAEADPSFDARQEREGALLLRRYKMPRFYCSVGLPRRWVSEVYAGEVYVGQEWLWFLHTKCAFD